MLELHYRLTKRITSKILKNPNFDINVLKEKLENHLKEFCADKTGDDILEDDFDFNRDIPADLEMEQVMIDIDINGETTAEVKEFKSCEKEGIHWVSNTSLHFFKGICGLKLVCKKFFLSDNPLIHFHNLQPWTKNGA